MPRYEAKLFLSFDANDDHEARNGLDLLLDDMASALDTQRHTTGAVVESDDALTVDDD